MSVSPFENITETAFLEICANYLDRNQDHPMRSMIMHSVASAIKRFLDPNTSPPYRVTGVPAGMSELLLRTEGPTIPNQEQLINLYDCLERAILDVLPAAIVDEMYEEALSLTVSHTLNHLSLDNS